jgi:hypothetical protein
LFDVVGAGSAASGRCSIKDSGDVATAVRHFFNAESQAAAAADGLGRMP